MLCFLTVPCARDILPCANIAVSRREGVRERGIIAVSAAARLAAHVDEHPVDKQGIAWA